MITRGLAMLLMVITVLSVSLGVKEDVAHGTPIKHGKQDPYNKDGSRNVHFIHELILGSHKLEEDFEELEPEEAKYRLGLLVKKMDKNEDNSVSKEELIDWILLGFRLLDEEEALEELDELDQDGDEKIQWKEFVESHFSYTEDEVKEMREKRSAEHEELLMQVDEEEKKFKAADENKDGFLDKSEFNAFYHPYSHEHMHHFEIDRTMHDNDKNKDGVLSMDEFIANAGDDKEWIITEKERFSELDVNKDSVLSKDEIRPWVLTDNREEAEEEADILLKEADGNEDGVLSEEEIVENHEIFTGSTITDYGRHLYAIKRHDEL